MAQLQILLCVIVCCIAYGSARPTIIDRDNSRHISQHDRSSSVRRDAEVNLSTELAKILRFHKRVDALRMLIALAEQGNDISVEIMPHKDLIPDHRETSERLLSTLNGEHEDDNLRVRVVDHRPNAVPQHMDDFIRKADALRQAALTARTCDELQKTFLKQPSIRIKVRCKSDPPQRRSATSKPSNPAGFRSHAPSRQLQLNGHRRINGLNRRHARAYHRRG